MILRRFRRRWGLSPFMPPWLPGYIHRVFRRTGRAVLIVLLDKGIVQIFERCLESVPDYLRTACQGWRICIFGAQVVNNRALLGFAHVKRSFPRDRMVGLNAPILFGQPAKRPGNVGTADVVKKMNADLDAPLLHTVVFEELSHVLDSALYEMKSPFCSTGSAWYIVELDANGQTNHFTSPTVKITICCTRTGLRRSCGMFLSHRN